MKHTNINFAQCNNGLPNHYKKFKSYQPHPFHGSPIKTFMFTAVIMLNYFCYCTKLQTVGPGFRKVLQKNKSYFDSEIFSWSSKVSVFLHVNLRRNAVQYI